MYDELTAVDIQKMQAEIDYRKLELRPKLGAALQEARAQGDLSENFEYKAAKQEVGRNNSRIRYLEQMIKTAKIVEDHSAADTVGLFDHVTIFMENLNTEKTFVLVTTLRQNPVNGYISKESPLGGALMGKKVGDRVHICVQNGTDYDVVIRHIQKGTDDDSLEISQY